MTFWGLRDIAEAWLLRPSMRYERVYKSIVEARLLRQSTTIR